MLFDPAWAKQFCAAWNDDSKRARLGGLGTVCFELRGPSPRRLCLHWDKVGTVTVAGSAAAASSFSASEASWSEFIAGRLPGTAAVLAGRIRFHGRLARIVPFSLAFNELARVAQGIGGAPQ